MYRLVEVDGEVYVASEQELLGFLNDWVYEDQIENGEMEPYTKVDEEELKEYSFMFAKYMRRGIN